MKRENVFQKKLCWFYFVFIVHVFLAVQAVATAAEENDIHTFNESKIILYTERRKKIDLIFKKSIFHAIESLYQAYKEKYDVVLPRELKVILKNPEMGKGMEANAFEDRISIYTTMGKAQIDLVDVLVLSHELAHLAIGHFEDKTQSEPFADFLGLNVARYTYKQQGMSFPKENSLSFFHQIKTSPFYQLLEMIEDHYGQKFISKFTQDAKEEFLKKGIVSRHFVNEWVSSQIKDEELLETFRLASLDISQELGVWFHPSAQPAGLRVELIPQLREENRYKFGFSDGDIITKINSKKIRSVDEFRNTFLNLLETSAVWDSATIEVLRNGKLVKLQAKVITISGKYRHKIVKKEWHLWPHLQKGNFIIYYKNMSKADIAEFISFQDFLLKQIIQKYDFEEISYPFYLFIERAPIQYPLMLDLLPDSNTQPCQSIYLAYPKHFQFSLLKILEKKTLPYFSNYLYMGYQLSPLEIMGGGGYLTYALYAFVMTETVLPLVFEYFQNLSPDARETLKEWMQLPIERFIPSSWTLDEKNKFREVFKFIISLEKTYGVKKLGEIFKQSQLSGHGGCTDTYAGVYVPALKEALKSLLGVESEILTNIN